MAKSQPLIYPRSVERYEEPLRECPEQPVEELHIGWVFIWILIGSAFWTGLAWWVLS